MWRWKKSGQQSGDPAEPTPQPRRDQAVNADGSMNMAEETQDSDMTEQSDQVAAGNEVQDRMVQLEAELDDAKNRTLRLMADFQNYQRRALQNEVVAKQQGVASVAGSVANVVDHFDTALAQTTKTASPEQILAGLRLIRDELVKSLAQHGVSQLNPQPGELFEPGKHEAVMQQKAEGIDPGHVVSTFQPGYTLASSGGTPERVLRPAKVVVAPME
jgi:molecular chaperone GrpE